MYVKREHTNNNMKESKINYMYREDIKDQIELAKKSIQKALGHISRLELLYNNMVDLKDGK